MCGTATELPPQLPVRPLLHKEEGKLHVDWKTTTGALHSSIHNIDQVPNVKMFDLCCYISACTRLLCRAWLSSQLELVLEA